MSSPAPSIPVTEEKMSELIGCTTRASGLMHLLATAYVKNDLGVLHPPSEEEINGILWLALRTGNELKAAMDAAFDSPPVNLQIPSQVAQ